MNTNKTIVTRTRVFALALTAAAAVAACGGGSDSSSDQPQSVSVQFAVTNGSTPVKCGDTLTGLGTTQASAAVHDLRFYITNLALVNDQGVAVPVTLDANEWQLTRGGETVSLIDLEDAYRGAERSISLRVPVVDAQGRVTLAERRLDVSIPKGVRAGQHLRLAGQGEPGRGNGPAGDLYLEIGFNPHPQFRVDGRDVFIDLPLAPWEAALGCSVSLPTPGGSVQLTIPAGSAAGRRLRLRGKGIPGNPPGDLYAVATLSLPPATSDSEKAAYRTLADAFDFNPRAHMKG